MKSLLIKDTTQDERRRIVEESLGMLGGCDDCMSGLADMYDDYIFGKRELAILPCPSEPNIPLP